MPHASMKLIPGVDVLKTPALNQSAVSESNLIRFLPDRDGFGLAQKYGGWVNFTPQLTGIARELCAFQDNNSNKLLGIGADDGLFYYQIGSSVIPITPRYQIDMPAPNFTTQGGDLLTEAGDHLTTESGLDIKVADGLSTVTVIDPGCNVVAGDYVWIKTPTSVDSLLLYGLYLITSRIDVDTYTIDAGTPASSSSENTGTITTFTTTNAINSINVYQPYHGYQAGDTVYYLLSTIVGGVTIYGYYTVDSVVDVNNYVIKAQYNANASATVTMNSGDEYLYYFLDGGAAAIGSGYGAGGYGVGGYGSGATTSTQGLPVTASDWFVNHYGEILIANPVGGALYYWRPTGSSTTALYIPNSPLANNGFFISMPQRQIVAWGSSFTGIIDPLLVRWCDAGNIDVWVASSTNLAGSYNIPEGSRIVTALQGPQQGLIWTDESVWAMQFVGYPDVYGFNKLATGVGAIGPKCAGVLNNVVYWMSPTQFSLLSNSGVQNIACPVWDVVYQDINPTQYDKIRIAVNSNFGEVAWFYASGTSTENDSYVKYNTQLQQWDYGKLARSAWIDQSVFGSPLAASSDKWIYQHEVGNDAYEGDQATGMLSRFRTGYFQLGDEGDHMTFVDQIWPDMKWGDYGHTEDAVVYVTFYVTNYPTDDPVTYGPYPMYKGMSPPYISTRVRGRLIAIEISSAATGIFWRVGNLRYRFQADGKF